MFYNPSAFLLFINSQSYVMLTNPSYKLNPATEYKGRVLSIQSSVKPHT